MDPDDALLARPIIIVGAPRSGTTLLSSILRRHEDLAFLDEPRMVWRYGNDRRSDLLRPEDASRGVVSYIRRTFAQRVAEAGRPRMLEKTPSNALRLAFVDCVFPDAQFVHVIRNGLDSVLSIHSYWQGYAHGARDLEAGHLRRRLGELSVRQAPHYAMEALRRFAPRALRRSVGSNVWGPRIPGIDTMLRDMDLIEVCSLQWRMCVEMARQYGRTLPAERYMECRIEDLSPELLGRILAFCGLPDSTAVRKQFEENFRPAEPGKRKAEADEEQLQRILQWIEPTMQWLGYETRGSRTEAPSSRR